MKRLIIIFALILSLFNGLQATHNRAGEITYKHISGLTFEFTVTTYTYRYSQANRSSLDVMWGDGTYSNVKIQNQGHIPIPGTDYLFNRYIARHTYSGSGVYTVLVEDPNRNLGVKNIPNSVNTVFSIKTTMIIGSFIGTNSTPELLNPPIDKAAKDHIFIHNPAAYDADGDSISYALTVCTGENGEPIEGFVLPPASDTLYIEKTIGDLTWFTPVDTGVYNIAILIEEWREGVRIGKIARDMQIDVYETDNNPPVNSFIPDYCVKAGETINFEVSSTDADNDSIRMYMVGGSMRVPDSPASFARTEATLGYSRGSFSWTTNCSHARQQPYSMVLKSEDVTNDISLVDISSFTIRVLHEAPENLVANPGVDSIQLNWTPSTCGTPAGYFIYRKIDSSNFVPDSCEPGVPSYTGFELFDVVEGGNSNSYTDDNHGTGLIPGNQYCYRITSFYQDGAESYSSLEICSGVIAGTPAMLKVSVEEHDATNGIIDIAWAVPQDLDTIIGDGPYRYEVFRQSPGETEFTPINTINTTDLLDTTYRDQNINTLIYPYTYTVTLQYQKDGNWQTMPRNEKASSLFMEIEGADNQLTLNMVRRAPWDNINYHVFRLNESSGLFDSIGSTNQEFYIDEGLKNGQEYQYRSKAISRRPLYNKSFLSENKSHQNGGIPIDTVPPCPPILSVSSSCDSAYNKLNWKTPFEICGDDDVVKYNIYYRPTLLGEFNKIDSLFEAETNSYTHYTEESLAGCYLVTAIDSFNNESRMTTENIACIDDCVLYELPNVFAPNNDGTLDIYTAINRGGFVKWVDMKIYSRYGGLVFKTNDPYINWDGKILNTNKVVSSGVYYYICDIEEPRITGTTLKTLSGFIHAFSGDNNGTIVE